VHPRPRRASQKGMSSECSWSGSPGRVFLPRKAMPSCWRARREHDTSPPGSVGDLGRRRADVPASRNQNQEQANLGDTILRGAQLQPLESVDDRVKVSSDRRMSPDLPRCTVNLIGGELDVDEPRLRTNGTLQSPHHCSIGYHPCHTNDLAMKAYPCKRNQEHKQEQEMQSNKLGYVVGSHKPMNDDTV
jgi:hypothetical protein